MTQFSAIILAGGRSSRMGQPKALLEIGGTTILERIVAELAPEFTEIVIVAAPDGIGAELPRLPQARIVRDEQENQGPLPALARGLRAIYREAAFACSCDLPLVSRRVASALCAMLDEHDAVVPETGGNLQPLHAVYRKRCADAIDAMIARGEMRMQRIVESVSAHKAGEGALRAIDPELRSFLNVNTPEDYQRALQLLSESSKSA